MAKAKKTKITIQTTVDTYATAQTRSSKLRLALEKSMNVERDTRTTIMDHVRKTNGHGKVAYQAANGDTLLVQVSAFGASVDTVKPGAQSLPELPPPPTAEVADSVRELLAKGCAAEAKRLIEESITNGTGVQANTAQTATEVNKTQEANILADIVRRNWKPENLADMYGSDVNPYRFIQARLVYPGLRRELPPLRPAIEQETFKSATMGPIGMSREFRKLLLENRNAVQTAITERNYNARGMIVSKSRGAIAKYVSELEQRVNSLTAALNKA